MKLELLTEDGYIEYDLETVGEPEIEEENDLAFEFGLPDPEVSNDKGAKGEWEKIKIVSLSGWKEVAMKNVKRCWKERNGLFSITICGKTKLPHQKKCRKTLYLKYQILGPGSKVEKDVKDCLKKAAVAAAGAFLLGGVVAVKTAFVSTFELCIEERLGSPKNFVEFKFDTDTECGDWSPVL